MQSRDSIRYRFLTLTGLAALLLCLAVPVYSSAAELKPFTSDGCTLFPDGTVTDRSRWCDCCLDHDMAYWKGGTAGDRLKSDKALRDCVLEQTRDKTLAETMYAGVRAGGHPAFPTWYRWAYGWPYGRGYKALSAGEQQQVREKLEEYWQEHPKGYCEKPEIRSAASGTITGRPAAWARPVPSEHLKNFHQLDDKVYRSAQPDRKGFRELTQLGIVNVLNLRDYHSDDEGKELGLNLYRVKMEAGDIETKKVVQALRFISNAQGSVLIHCWHGSDRTGLISAMYRILFQGWTKEDALDELVNGGYGYHPLYKNIPEFITTADMDSIRKQVQAVKEQI